MKRTSAVDVKIQDVLAPLKVAANADFGNANKIKIPKNTLPRRLPDILVAP